MAAFLLCGALAFGPARKFHYTMFCVFCQAKSAKKTAQSYIPKLVQNYLLTFLKTFAIIYLQGKERGKQEKEKNLKKPLDKLKSL